MGASFHRSGMIMPTFLEIQGLPALHFSAKAVESDASVGKRGNKRNQRTCLKGKYSEGLPIKKVTLPTFLAAPGPAHSIEGRVSHMPHTSIQDLMRRIPGVDVLLHTDALQKSLGTHPRKIVLDSIRHVLEETRKRLRENTSQITEEELQVNHIVNHVIQRIEDLSDYTLRPVVNATGIVVHTNLGRSLLPREALERLQLIGQGFNNLEYDLERGKRGSRYVHAEAILCELTGADAALVVNNNAGAVFLVLNSLAQGKEVIVSRGQLVEIGGSFRIPDVMRASGAILQDVGCTNRTHLQDYAGAIGESTALLMKVHTSNYRIVGFSSEVTLQELVSLGQKHEIPVIEDLGSGSFIDFRPYGLTGEPTVQHAVNAGADMVTFSGDKLLGGPQVGIILGREDLIARCRKNPLTRALRVDKMALGALEATLRLYRDEREALLKIPTLRMITMPLTTLEEKAEELLAAIRAADAEECLDMEKVASNSQVGGGALPAQNLKTWAVAVRSDKIATQRIETALRKSRTPIIGRIESDRYLMDVRTLQDGEVEIIQEAFRKLIKSIL